MIVTAPLRRRAVLGIAASARQALMLFFAAALLISTPALALAPTVSRQSTTVVIVRHAEAEDDSSNDPPLSEAGLLRAAELSTALRRAGVSVILTTQLRRTIETAAGVAQEMQVDVEVIAVERGAIATHVDAVRERVHREQPGGGILIVGHSNTVPLIVEALSGIGVPEIGHHEHDRLFLIVLERGHPPRLVESRYGAASAP